MSRITSRVLFGALLLVLALSPFEAGYKPLGRFIWATFTDLEAALMLLGLTYVLTLVFDGSARRRALHMPLLLPIIALVGASLLSTFLGEYRTLGLAATSRLIIGVLVYASAWEALRNKGRFFAALATFVGAGLVSAILGLLEFAPWFNIEPFLSPFKPKPTTVGSILRLSGTFEYANGAALYFEMALPVLVAIAALFSSRLITSTMFGEGHVSTRWRRTILALLYVIVGIYVMALILTLSRAALAGLVVALAVFAVVAILRRRTTETRNAKRKTRERERMPKSIKAEAPSIRGRPAPASGARTDANYVSRSAFRVPRLSRPQSTSYSYVWRSLAVTVGIMAVGGLVVFVTQPMFRLRLLTQNDLSWYKAAVTADTLPPLTASEILTVPVMVRNEGEMTWPAGGVVPVHVSYHWLSPVADVYLVYEGLRSVLPHDVSPGETASVLAVVQAPPQPGDYRLQWDLVHENVTWFNRKQPVAGEVRAYTIGVAKAGSNMQAPPSAMPAPLDVQAISDTASTPRTKLWSVAWAMFLAHPITGVGPDGFRNLYGKYAGVTEWDKSLYTNNTYIEMFTNLGMIGGLAFLWLGGMSLWKAARALLRAPIGAMWVLGLGVTAALVAFFAHGMVDYFLFATPLYVIFWFLLAASGRWTTERQ